MVFSRARAIAPQRLNPALQPATAGALAFVLKGYPRLSETFIAQEIHALEEAGLDIRIVSLRHPTDARRHPVHHAIRAPVLYLPEYVRDEPARVVRAWRRARRRPGYRNARRVWLADLRRDPTANRARRFAQALVLAEELWPQVGHLHAHFLHTPGSVARYTSLVRGLPWTCSAHAKDIWTIPEWEKREKLADCRWLVTCTEANRRHLLALAPSPDRVERIYHGLDLERFGAPDNGPRARDGSEASDPVLILSVGRAVEKKGYDDLLAALAALPERLQWRFEHVGTGPALQRLEETAGRHGLGPRVRWLGALTQDEVIERYRNADLFVLASRIAADGDRDGLPNVLMEAQSQALPCVSTHVSAIPELIEDGVTGLLCPERDPATLAAHIERLIVAPRLREVLGRAGQQRVWAKFGMRDGVERLLERFRAAQLRSTAP